MRTIITIKFIWCFTKQHVYDETMFAKSRDFDYFSNLKVSQNLHDNQSGHNAGFKSNLRFDDFYYKVSCNLLVYEIVLFPMLQVYYKVFHI